MSLHPVTTASNAARFASSAKSGRRRIGYLTKSQVRKFLDAGSFLTQEYRVLLNTRVVIVHERLGASELREGAALAADLVHELGMALKRWAPNSCSNFHYLYAHERGQETGFSTILVAYIPNWLADDAEAWLFDNFLAKRCGWPAPKAAVQLRITRHEDELARRHRHFQLMRLLCRGVDPTIKVRHRGERRALIDVLRIPTRLRRTPAILDLPQRWRVSKTIGIEIQRTARNARLAPLSAFGDKAFDYLFTGWELSEYLDRQREKEERARARTQIEQQWPEGAGQRQDQVRAAALEQLRLSWPQDPRRRLRSWNRWWLDNPDN